MSEKDTRINTNALRMNTENIVSEYGRVGVSEKKAPSYFVHSYRELNVYKNALDLSIQVFKVTKTFPIEERYNLTDQIRRSSRSICANLAEAWRKRRYKAAFISKLSDAETEACETQVWVEIAQQCNYISLEEAHRLDRACEQILAQIVRMISTSDKWIISENE